MDASVRKILRRQAETVVDNLEKNNMRGFFVESKKEVPALVASLLHEGDTVAVGGSMTLVETGVLHLLRTGPYRYLDRYAPDLTPEDMRELFIRSFSADAYLCSANAVTMDGKLYNVDGNSNRVAAICYGPRSVIMVVGVNKIVRDVEEAVRRVKRRAAPANAVRLGCETYCAKAGECCAAGGGMADGCQSDSRICSNYVVSARQREKGRIKVILVGEETGY